MYFACACSSTPSSSTEAGTDAPVVYECPAPSDAGPCENEDGGPLGCPTSAPYCMNVQGYAPTCSASYGWCALDPEVVLPCGSKANCGMGVCANGTPCSDIKGNPGTCQCQ